MGRAQAHRGYREDERRMRNVTGKHAADSEVEGWEKMWKVIMSRDAGEEERRHLSEGVIK